MNSGLQFTQQNESSISKPFKTVRGCGVVCGMLIVLTYRHKSSLEEKKIDRQRILVWGFHYYSSCNPFTSSTEVPVPNKNKTTSVNPLILRNRHEVLQPSLKLKKCFYFEIYFVKLTSQLMLFAVILVDTWGVKVAALPLEVSKTAKTEQN